MPSYGHIVVLKIIIENISQMRLEGRSSGGWRRSRHLILWLLKLAHIYMQTYKKLNQTKKFKKGTLNALTSYQVVAPLGLLLWPVIRHSILQWFIFFKHSSELSHLHMIWLGFFLPFSECAFQWVVNNLCSTTTGCSAGTEKNYWLIARTRKQPITRDRGVLFYNRYECFYIQVKFYFQTISY